MNKTVLSCVGLLYLISGCTSSSVLSTHDTAHGKGSTPVATHEELRKFDIPAGDAPVSLNAFSIQSNKQVLFDYNVMRNRKTRAVEGTLEPSVALKSMLDGTGLVADNVNDWTYAITARH